VTALATPTPLERHLREGDQPVRATPLDVFNRARSWFIAGRRIDMGQLAAEFGLHRTTLYRWVGTRDRLLGEILWSLAEPTARRTDPGPGVRGAERIAKANEAYLRAARDAPFLRRFLEQEPEIALRVLTTKDSVLQARSVEFTRRLIEEEVDRGTIDPPMSPADLAYLIVRIGESFLYAPLITGAEPEPEKATQAILALLR
jgi:AcrR family transcriptional regulator